MFKYIYYMYNKLHINNINLFIIDNTNTIIKRVYLTSSYSIYYIYYIYYVWYIFFFIYIVFIEKGKYIKNIYIIFNNKNKSNYIN